MAWVYRIFWFIFTLIGLNAEWFIKVILNQQFSKIEIWLYTMIVFLASLVFMLAARITVLETKGEE